jgi:hypothetical protein
LYTLSAATSRSGPVPGIAHAYPAATLAAVRFGDQTGREKFGGPAQVVPKEQPKLPRRLAKAGAWESFDFLSAIPCTVHSYLIF